MREWLERLASGRVLPAIITFLLGAQLVAVFTVDDDDEPTLEAGAATTTTVVRDPDAVTSTTAAPGASTNPTTAGRASATTTAPPSVFAGPKQGEYRYRVQSKLTEDGETSEETYDAQLVVTDVGGGRQRHRFIEQGGVSVVEDLIWRADGRYLVATDDGFGSTGCDLEPDIRTAPSPATPGTTRFRSSCTIRLEGEPPETVTLSGTFRVVGNERRSVGGASVDVVHFHVEFDDDDPSDGPDALVIDEFYAPSLGLTVEETHHASGSGEIEGETYTYDELSTRRLLSSQPEG